MPITGVLAVFFYGSMFGQVVSSPSIDGFLDDAFWSLRARVWEADDPRLPGNSALFYLGFDAEYLYFAADVTDATVTGTHQGRKSKVWEDDAVEIFLDFGEGTALDRTPVTFEYGFSAAGGVNWTRGTSDGSGKNFPAHDWPPKWDSKVRWAVQHKGKTTINLRGDRDAGYIVEARIPLDELGQEWPFQPKRTIGVCFLNICRPEIETGQEFPIATLPNIDFSNNHNPSLWQRIDPNWQGPLPIRGLVEMLPLWLGTGLNDNYWTQFESAQGDPVGPWFNRDDWTAKLESMKSQNLNALLFRHPHPFAGLLPLTDYPGACYFTPDQLDKHVEQFKWLLAEAKRNGVKVYLFTENICLPRQWAESQQLSELGSDSPLARTYTRYAVAELFRAYPDLAGLATVAAENPPGCVDFVVDAIVGGLKDYRSTAADSSQDKSAPKLIYLTWCSYPEDARRIIDAYPSTQLVHYLQYEQWFKPMVDPRVDRFERWTAGCHSRSPAPAVPMITIGGPKSSLKYLFWGDPEWLHNLAVDLRRRGTAGILFEPDCADAWLAGEALAAYTYNAGDVFNRKRWEKRLDEVYGIGEYAGQLLEAVQHASAIIPRLVTLVNDQSERYMPQFGLLLAHYLEMPTLSTYVFDRTQAIDDRGRLTPRLGMTWPNPNWGECIAGIRADVNLTAPTGSTRPEQIAEDIRRHVDACKSRLTGLRHVKPTDSDKANVLATFLDRIELNAALGEHFYHKINAACGWQRYRTKRGRGIDCTRPLNKSVEAWQWVVQLSDKLYPESLDYWQSQPVSVPPWTQEQIRQSYKLVRGHWRDQLPIFERELILVQQNIAIDETGGSLPLWDQLTAEVETNLMAVQGITFETAEDPRLKITEEAEISSQKELVLGGKKSLLVDTRGLDDEWHVVLTTDPAYFPLLSHRPYQISAAYRVIDRGEKNPAPFAIGLRSATSGEDVGDDHIWGAPDGHVGTRFIRIPALEHENFFLYVAVHGQAAIVIDNIKVDTPRE